MLARSTGCELASARPNGAGDAHTVRELGGALEEVDAATHAVVLRLACAKSIAPKSELSLCDA